MTCEHNITQMENAVTGDPAMCPICLAARLAKLVACCDNELSGGQWIGRGPGQKFKDALAEARTADSAEPRETV